MLKYIFLPIFLCAVFFSSCQNDNYYPTVIEDLRIVNLTNAPIFIEFFPIYGDIIIQQKEVKPLQETSLVVNWSLNKPWLSENEINGYLSSLRIYTLNNTDTFFVASKYYDNKALWQYRQFSEYDFGEYKSIISTLKISPQMITK